MEDAMCHSTYWAADEARRKQEAKDREARGRRTETINHLLGDAEKQAGKTEPEEAAAKEAVPAQ
jgi:hypothetical protein